jgi:flagellar biosynthesis anti-sigma factor FlgM
MRIENNPAAQALPESGRTSNSNSASGQALSTASNALGEDQAQLSGGHVQVQALAAQALQFPEVRQEKVNALRQVVLSGGYQVSPEQVAGAMFDHMLAEPAA